MVVSTNETRRKVGRDTLLVLAEPIEGAQTEALLDDLMGAPNVLLILPKWRARPWPGNRRWARDVERVDLRRPTEVLRRVDSTAALTFDSGKPAVASRFGNPELGDPQLARAPRATALASVDGRWLVGSYQRGGQRIWVLTDPDILNNHGIDNGGDPSNGMADNARFALALFRNAMPEGGSVVFDETIHGFIDGNALWRAALRPPFLIATLIAGLAFVLLLWAAVGRIGKPVADSPAIPMGHSALIDNTTELLIVGGQKKQLLDRYFKQSAVEVAKALHIKTTFRPAWPQRFDEIAEQRGLKVRYHDIETRMTAFMRGDQRSGARALAVDIYQWKKAMTDGS